MHELSIATAILERVDAEVSKNPGVRPVRVGVRIGAISGVDPESLAFGFEVLVKDTGWDPLALDIEWCPRRQRCQACEHEFEVKDYDTTCPKCRGLMTACISGEELDIAFIEVAD